MQLSLLLLGVNSKQYNQVHYQSNLDFASDESLNFNSRSETRNVDGRGNSHHTSSELEFSQQESIQYSENISIMSNLLMPNFGKTGMSAQPTTPTVKTSAAAKNDTRAPITAKLVKKDYTYDINNITLNFSSYREGLWNNVDVFLRLNKNQFVTQYTNLYETTTLPINQTVSALGDVELSVLEFNHIDGRTIDYDFHDYELHGLVKFADWKDDLKRDNYCAPLIGKFVSKYTDAEVEYSTMMCKRLK